MYIHIFTVYIYIYVCVCGGGGGGDDGDHDHDHPRNGSTVFHKQQLQQLHVIFSSIAFFFGRLRLSNLRVLLIPC